MSRKLELIIQITLASWIARDYPDILFRSDLGGIRLTMGLARQARRLQGGQARGWPDMFIAEPRQGYLGLFGEIKTGPDEIYTLKGDFRKDPHILEQAIILERLRARGYKADFWLGLDHGWQTIREYLGSK